MFRLNWIIYPGQLYAGTDHLCHVVHTGVPIRRQNLKIDQQKEPDRRRCTTTQWSRNVENVQLFAGWAMQRPAIAFPVDAKMHSMALIGLAEAGRH
jgi:hypothetical protein